MAVTKSFKELVQSRVARDPDFAAALLGEGIDTMLTGGVDTGKAILHEQEQGGASADIGMNDDTEIIRGSGNVFLDLDHPDADGSATA
jgi:hypothetical protein